ncbi:MAG: NUDIX domain-containing protein [Dehalococcoidia bacterium]
MSEPRFVPRKLSAGVILVDREGRVLLQLRDSDPRIMFPDHWGITGGAGNAGETPEQIARREVEEETGLTLGRIEPFRAYYFHEQRAANGKKGSPSKASADYELYLFHAPCETPAEEMVCGEGRALRFFAPHELPVIDVAYNHRDVLTEFFSTPAYAGYLRGTAFAAGEPSDAVAQLRESIAAGEPWFEALMRSIAVWDKPEEDAGGRRYRYLIGDEAFDWLLLAERLIAGAGGHIPEDEAERLLFEARAPTEMDDAGLREWIGESKHRAHLNYLYGVIVEEALQYAVELEVAKEYRSGTFKDGREREPVRDPVFERIYGRPQKELLREFRDELGLPRHTGIALSELREFLYWLFKYRTKQCEPARVASDTRKALAQLSTIEDASRRSRRARDSRGGPSPVAEEIVTSAG